MTALVVVASALGAYLVGALVRFAVNALDRTLATEAIRVYSDSADRGYRYAIMAIEGNVGNGYYGTGFEITVKKGD